MYLTKDVDNEAARQDKKRKTTEEIHGCRDRGHAVGWLDTRGCWRWDEMEADDLLWWLLKGEAGRKRRIDITFMSLVCRKKTENPCTVKACNSIQFNFFIQITTTVASRRFVL